MSCPVGVEPVHGQGLHLRSVCPHVATARLPTNVVHCTELAALFRLERHSADKYMQARWVRQLSRALAGCEWTNLHDPSTSSSQKDAGSSQFRSDWVWGFSGCASHAASEGLWIPTTKGQILLPADSLASE